MELGPDGPLSFRALASNANRVFKESFVGAPLVVRGLLFAASSASNLGDFTTLILCPMVGVYVGAVEMLHHERMNMTWMSLLE